MKINYGKLQDLIVVAPQSPDEVLRVEDYPDLSLNAIASTNILRRLLRYASWPDRSLQSSSGINGEILPGIENGSCSTVSARRDRASDQTISTGGEISQCASSADGRVIR